MSENTSTPAGSAGSSGASSATKLNAGAREFVPKLNAEAREFSPASAMAPAAQQQVPMMAVPQQQYYYNAYPPQYQAAVYMVPQNYGAYYPYGYDPNYGFVQPQPQAQAQIMRGNNYNNRQGRGPRQYPAGSGAPHENWDNSNSAAAATSVESSAPASDSALDSNANAAETANGDATTETSAASAHDNSSTEHSATVQSGDVAPASGSSEPTAASHSGEASKTISTSTTTVPSNGDISVEVPGVRVVDDYEMNTRSVGESRDGKDKEKDKSAAGGSEWTRKKVETPKAAVESDDSNWRRDASSGWGVNDGIIRYTKLELLNLNSLKKMPPAEIRALYPHHSKTERFPRIPKGWKVNLTEDSTPHEDELKIFNSEKVFKFDAAKHSNVDDPEVILRKARLILNQLSENNFDRLSNEFMTAGIDKHELMGRVVEMLVKKAQVDESFCGMYANLAKKLSTTWASQPSHETDSGANAGAGAESLGDSFKFALLNRAKEEFEVDRIAQLQAIRNNEEMLPEDREEKEIKLKKCYLGMMRFVGELYLVDMIRSKTIEECVNTLFNKKTEEDLVCLNKFLQTVGAKYDQKKSNKQFLDKLFADMEELIASHSSSRVRFLMKDLKLLRQENWQVKGKDEKVSAAPSPAPMSSGSNRGMTPKGAGPSPRFGAGLQDARRQSGAPTTPVTAAAPSPVPGDEWSTVATSKRSGKAPLPPSSSAAPAGAKDAKGGNNNSGKYGALVSPADKKKPGGFGTSGDKSAAGEKSPKRESKGASAQRSAGVALEKTEAASSTPKLELAIPSVDGVDSAPTTPAVHLVGFDGAVDKETLKKTKSALDGFFASNDVADANADISSLVHPNGMGEVFKYLVNYIMEKKDDERSRFLELVDSWQEGELLSSEQALRGVLLFLNDVDEIAIDVPRAGTYFAAIVAHLIARGQLSLSFLGAIPDENNFSFSSHRHTFLGDVLSRLVASIGAAEAEAAYKACGVALKNLVIEFKFPKETPEAAVANFLATYPIPFEI